MELVWGVAQASGTQVLSVWPGLETSTLDTQWWMRETWGQK